jgi:uncharacterized protein YbaR (Trm112 family)/SAM-dependent methyltransferase
MNLHISPSDKVLEIGSGNNPNPRSNVLCDRFVNDNGQRAGKFSIVIDRPLIVGDGYKLPFADKSFDYVIASHILEHMERPEKFVAELVRVAKAGYIEVPSIYAERLFGWNFHLWYCQKIKNGIVLHKKTEGERFMGFYHHLIAENIWFRRFFEEHEDYFNIHYEWKGCPNIHVKRSIPTQKFLDPIDGSNWKLLSGVHPNAGTDKEFYIEWMTRRVKKKLKKIFSKLRWRYTTIFKKQSVISELLPVLRCPNCRSTKLLAPQNTEILCRACGNVYEIDETMPVMLPGNEKKKGY